MPPAVHVWRGLRVCIGAAYVWFLLAALPAWIVRYWFLDSLGQAGIFWTNFIAQFTLFALGTSAVALVVAGSVRRYAVSATVRRGSLHVGAWTGMLAGWLWSYRYEEYLLALNGGPFGEVDPLFGHDIGFYVFVLPAIETTVSAITAIAAIWVVSAVVGQLDAIVTRQEPTRASTWSMRLGSLVTGGLNAAMFVLGLSLVARTFLARYALLVKDNGDTGVRTGAAFLDVDGVWSTLNLIYVSTAVELAIMAVVGVTLHRLGRHASRPSVPDGVSPVAAASRVGLRPSAALVSGLLALDLVFFLGVVAKKHLLVAPNEPTIQVPFIERHIAATTRGYHLDKVEVVDWRPPQAPVSPEALQASATVRGAPLLPSWVSSLEEPPDVQHYQRVRTSNSTLVYGPVLQIYEQEQQLRPYYKFISVDGVRYRVNGERRMYVSAARELPTRGFAGPRQWLQHWGSSALMLTHGFGLVMSPVNELRDEGGPTYVVADIPPHAVDPAFEAEPRIYFGEGAKDDYILTGVRNLKELDYPTRQFRSESVHAPGAQRGIPVDSWWKRIVLALYTGDINEFLFTSFVDPDRTSVQLFRTPMQRVTTIAPFLFVDSNPFAFIADKKIQWMVNGLTTTDRYPYSFREVLGDKADERAVERFPERVINYAEDSVKAVIDAYSGEPHFYRMSDDPIVSAWARVYPGLFEPASAMPAAVEAQLSYPLQWFHVQFDDIYKRYHQTHPIEFYNAEDLWDDADEVVGSIGRGLTEFGTTDESTFSYEGYNVLLDPADLPPGAAIGAPGDLQFGMVMPFTPEGARNLRSMIVALQDGDNYGRLLDYRVPQGAFIPGPEQADTLIDNDAQVNQQITLWVRHGSEVVRGHTIAIPVAGDLLYIEPLWIVSLQNSLPQIKLVSVVYRGRTTMGTSLAEAIQKLGVSEADEQRANELPWFSEAQSRGR